MVHFLFNKSAWCDQINLFDQKRVQVNNMVTKSIKLRKHKLMHELRGPHYVFIEA